VNRNKYDMYRFLLEAGADRTVEDNTRRSAMARTLSIGTCEKYTLDPNTASEESTAHLCIPQLLALRRNAAMSQC
jgi:hypothetical protein